MLRQFFSESLQTSIRYSAKITRWLLNTGHLVNVKRIKDGKDVLHKVIEGSFMKKWVRLRKAIASQIRGNCAVTSLGQCNHLVSPWVPYLWEAMYKHNHSGACKVSEKFGEKEKKPSYIMIHQKQIDIPWWSSQMKYKETLWILRVETSSNLCNVNLHSIGIHILVLCLIHLSEQRVDHHSSTFKFVNFICE